MENEIMTREEARMIIQSTLLVGVLPIHDCILYRNWEDGCITEYTFRELLCIAYDLKKKEDE